MCAVARIAQSVEQRIENPRVRGSIPRPGTNEFLKESQYFLSPRELGFFMPEIPYVEDPSCAASDLKALTLLSNALIYKPFFIPNICSDKTNSD